MCILRLRNTLLRVRATSTQMVIWFVSTSLQSPGACAFAPVGLYLQGEFLEMKWLAVYLDLLETAKSLSTRVLPVCIPISSK